MTVSRRVIAPPQLRVPDGNRGRHATYLEVFFDLVFVVAVGAASDVFAQNLSWRGAVRASALFVPVWWAWVGHTVYATRFDTDDVIQRLWTFGMMLAAAGMAATIPHAFDRSTQGFAAAYVGARVCLLALYLRARRYVPETRPITSLYLVGFGAGAACWAVSLFVPATARYALWAVGLAADFVTPWLGLRRLQRAPVDNAHLPDRFGSFTLIVLGEVILVIVAHLSGGRLNAAAIGCAVCAFGITVAAWWQYFTFLEIAPFVENLRSGQPYIYLHLPVLAGLTALGVGLGEAIAEANEPHIHAVTCAVLAAGFVLWHGGAMGLKRMSIGEPFPVFVWARYCGAIALLILGAGLGSRFSALVMLAILWAVLVVHVVFDMRHWMQWEQGHADQRMPATTAS